MLVIKCKNDALKIIDSLQIKFGNKYSVSIGLFGSMARGDNTESSDIDIVYKFDDASNIDEVRFYIDATKYIETLTPTKYDFIPYHRMQEDDIEMDAYVVRRGLCGPNEHSAFKTMLKDVVWSGKRETSINKNI